MRKIDMETIKFLKELEELKEKTKNGIKEFKEATPENFNNCIFYVYNESTDDYKIVLNADLNSEEHKPYCYYNNWYVSKDEDGKLYVFYEQDNNIVIIIDDKWYVL